MPPGVYSICPLPTPCEETPAPSALHRAPWHLESKPPFEGKVQLAPARPCKEKDKTHRAILLPCHPLDLLRTRPGCCHFPPVPLCAALGCVPPRSPRSSSFSPFNSTVWCCEGGRSLALPPPRDKRGYEGHSVCGSEGFCSVDRNRASQLRGELGCNGKVWDFRETERELKSGCGLAWGQQGNAPW